MGKINTLLVVLSIFAATSPVFAARTHSPKDGETPELLPALPRVRLAPIEGFDDDAAYIQSMRERAAALASSADEVDNLEAKIGGWLAAVNLILSGELEPICSARLWGVDSSNEDFTKADTRDAFGRLDSLIEKVRAELGDVSQDNEPDEDWLAQSRRRLSTLAAFADGMRAYLLSDGDEAARGRRRAASKLSILRENQDRTIAAAALMWQAHLRFGDGDGSRLLTLLGPALSDPHKDTWPYAFYSRMLRCRVISARGGHAASLALLTQLEERCTHWVTAAKDQAIAERTITWARIRVMREWYKQVSNDSAGSETTGAESTWLVDRINILQQERFSEDADTLLRLTHAIPIVAPPPEPGALPVGSSSDDG